MNSININGVSMNGISKIIVIKLRHIGDVLLTTPVYRALKENFPDASITALINSGTEEMISLNPFVSETIIFDRKVKELSFFKKYAKEYEFLKAIKRGRYDLAIDLTGGDRGAIISYLSGARYRLGKDSGKPSLWGKKRLYTRPVVLDGATHVVSQNLALLNAFGIKAASRAVEIFVPEDVEFSVEKSLKARGIARGEPFVHVHPTARWFFKCWRDDYMATVISWLLKAGVKVSVTSSADARETEMLGNIVSRVRDEVPNHAGGLAVFPGTLTLKGLAALSRSSFMFFGVDSAPMHVAAAMDRPVTALFGPSGAFNWGPWDNHGNHSMQYAERNGIQHSGCHTTIQQDWPCVPCGQDGCAGTKHSKCLDDLHPEEIIPILSDKLNKILQKDDILQRGEMKERYATP
ncbi:MAG: putative lipopolysaccharide heptosyltransferase III [Nitrospirae bacterium]|nr:putative lipopolysaccharide heptosyltransferase III [Nitrospirota bacterium]